MGHFTLQQLAHFDRCLFPDDVAKDIGRIGGYAETEVLLMQMTFRHHVKTKPLSVVGMYQEHITDERFCAALDALVTEFCCKNL